MLLGMTTFIGSSVELAPGWPIGILTIARLWLARLVRVVAAFFAAADPAVRPQAFEDHLGGCRNLADIPTIVGAEAADVVEERRHLRKLLLAFRRRNGVGELQFAAIFEPLNDWLEVDFGEAPRMHAADR